MIIVKYVQIMRCSCDWICRRYLEVRILRQ